MSARLASFLGARLRVAALGRRARLAAGLGDRRGAVRRLIELDRMSCDPRPTVRAAVDHETRGLERILDLPHVGDVDLDAQERSPVLGLQAVAS